MKRTRSNLHFRFVTAAISLACAPSIAAEIPAATTAAATTQAKTATAFKAPLTDAKARTVKVDDFEAGVRDWTAFVLGAEGSFGPDVEAKIDVTSVEGQVRSGKNSLRYSYDVQPKRIGILALLRSFDLSGMRSVRFALKCDAATVVAFGVRENGGARYTTYFYCPAKKWQSIAIDLNELKQNDDSRDENDRLDVDQIREAYIADAAGIFASRFSRQTGAHRMWLDDIEYSSQTVQPRAISTHAADDGAPLVIDDFEGGTLRWLPLLLQLGADLKIEIIDSAMTLDRRTAPDDAASNGGRQALKIPYTRVKGSATAWLRNLQNLEQNSLKKAKSLHADLKVSKSGLYMFSLKEKDGSRYQQVFELKAADNWKNLALPLTDLKLAGDSTDENDKLDLVQIEELSIGDLTALLPRAPAANATDAPAEDAVTLWIDNVRFEGETPTVATK